MEGSNVPVPEAPVTNGAASLNNGFLNVSAQDFTQVPLQDQYNIQSSEAQPQAQPISAGELITTSTIYGLGLISICIDEIALYDRQIRLWGVKAQEKYGGLHSWVLQLVANIL